VAASDDIDRIMRAVERGIRRSLVPKEMLRLGRLAVSIIQQRTRRGFGVKKTGDRRRKLKALSKRYIEKRRRANLSRFTSAKKSNLTFSGQMLSSMRAEVRRFGIVKITFSPRRTGGGNNRQIAEIVSRERPFNNLSAVEIRALVESYDTTMQATIDKALRGL
jgi:hypothetical protein